MSQIRDDIQEIKADVKEMRTLLQKSLIDSAAFKAATETRLNGMAARVNSIIAVGLAIITGLATASWAWIKLKLGVE